jgi:hypothetical protein
MLTLTTETQIDPLNGCFVNLMCNQASTYRVTGDGSHIFHSYYDKPVLDLFTHTTASRVSPCIRLAQDSNTSPFLQCCQETVPQFTVHSNGNLRWGSQWYLHTNNTSLTIGSNTTTLLSIASNGDTQITGNTRLIGNVNMGTSDGASTTTVVGTMMIKGSSNSALDTPLNPSAYNSVMLMEDGVGPTLRAGYVQGHATKESGYIRLVPGTSNKTGQLIYRGHPGNSFTVEFDVRFGDINMADGIWFMFNQRNVPSNMVADYGLGGYALFINIFNDNTTDRLQLFWDGQWLRTTDLPQDNPKLALVSNAWIRVKIIFCMNQFWVTLNEFIVPAFYPYTDIRRELSVNNDYYGFGAWSGGNATTQDITNIRICKSNGGPITPVNTLIPLRENRALNITNRDDNFVMKVQENGEKSFYYQSGAIRLGSSGDTNHEITFNASVDGPKIKGNLGGLLSTTSKDIMRWNNSGVQIHNDDLEVGTSTVRKTIRYNGEPFATRAFFTRFISGYNWTAGITDNIRALLNTENPATSSNDKWRVFCIRNIDTSLSGGTPELGFTHQQTYGNNALITVQNVPHDDTNFMTGIGRDYDNCLQVSSEGYYRFDFDIALQGRTDDADHRLRWMFMKNQYTTTNRLPISMGVIDIDGQGNKNFHLCGASSMVPGDKLFLYYQSWDAPSNVGFNNSGNGDAIYWSYASITMHSI